MIDPDALDGNAAAGLLREIFAFDATSAIVTCIGCGADGALATLRLYGGPLGAVLRCPHCDAVNLRAARTGPRIHLDCSGIRLLSVATDADGPVRSDA